MAHSVFHFSIGLGIGTCIMAASMLRRIRAGEKTAKCAAYGLAVAYACAVTAVATEDQPPAAITVLPVRFLEIMKFLRNSLELNFNSLACLSGVDQPTEEQIVVVYNLFSLTHQHHLTVKVKLDRDNPAIDSVHEIWKVANWHERECYDLFGVDFKNHPDLVRILLPEDWEGFPLRKDYVAPDSFQGMRVTGSLEEGAGEGGEKHIS